MQTGTSYTSYLLRLTRVGQGSQATWVASVLSTATGDRRSFPSVEALAVFLVAEYGGSTPAGKARPVGNRAEVLRAELLARLDQGLSRQLTLLSAPPGFGKNALVSQWLERSDTRWAVVSLDEDHNDLSRFLRSLALAVEARAPGACPTVQDLLHASSSLDGGALAGALVGDLAGLSHKLILVLRDYQVIRSDEVHEVVRELLRRRLEALHMVIITRYDPPLPLVRLRAENQINELRPADLRITPPIHPNGPVRNEEFAVS
jgi:ATP/maltotriose-dependent transcriptional regulator MalT